MKHLSVIPLAILLASTAPAIAQPDVAEPVVSRIEEQGYSVTEISRTWLGRILITAQNETHLREVVLNRVTGQVLSDKAFPLGDDGGADTSAEDSVDGLGQEAGDTAGDAAGAVGDAAGGVTGGAADGVGGSVGGDVGGGVGGGVGGIGGVGGGQ